jgi:NADPH:quinone reductase-like Zn-dependent oxidoreductase
VGSILVQLVLACNDLQHMATASRQQSRDWLHSLGVQHVINHHELMAEQIHRLNLPGVQAAVSITHTEQLFDALLEILEPQGSLTLIDDPTHAAIAENVQRGHHRLEAGTSNGKLVLAGW